jgi:hypothetical protein
MRQKGVVMPRSRMTSLEVCQGVVGRIAEPRLIGWRLAGLAAQRGGSRFEHPGEFGLDNFSGGSERQRRDEHNL